MQPQYSAVRTAIDSDEEDSDIDLSDDDEFLMKPRPESKFCDKGWCLLVLLLVLFGVGCVIYAIGDDFEDSSQPLPESDFSRNLPEVSKTPPPLRIDTQASASVSSSGYSYEQPDPTHQPTDSARGEIPVLNSDSTGDETATLELAGEDLPTQKPSDPPTPTFAPTPKPVAHTTDPPTPTFAPTPKPIETTTTTTTTTTTLSQSSENGPRFDGNPDQTSQVFQKTHSDPNRIDDLGTPRKSMDFNLDEGIKVLEDRMKYLCDLFPGNDENCYILQDPFNPIPENSPEQKGKMTPMQRKLARVILEEKPEDRHFVASFTGSSNSAGHGALGKHAYPLLMNHVVKETFSKIGVDFTSRNQALGSMSAFPHSTYCHSSVFGFDADFVTYEFGMFREGDCPKEIMSRIAFGMPRQPVVGIMNPGGPNHCASHYSNKYGYWKSTNLNEFMGHMGLSSGNVMRPEDHGKTVEWYLTDDYLKASGRSEADLKWFEENTPFTDDDKASRKRDMDNLNCNLHKRCNSDLQQQYPDLGFYNYQFALGSYSDYLPFYMIRSQLCRNAHHPSDLGHFMAASQVGYQFLKQMIEVLNLIKANNNEDGLRRLYGEATVKFPIPPSKFGNCRIGGEEVTPICYTSFAPQNGPTLYDMVEDYGTWKKMERFSPYEKERHEYDFRDVHAVLEGDANSGWITFKPVTVTEDIVKNHNDGTAWLVVCNGMERYCDAKGRDKPCTRENFKKDVVITVNGEEIKFTDYPFVEAGKKRDTPWLLQNWLPMRTDTQETFDGITDLMHLRSGLCQGLKNVTPGDYKIAVKVLNPSVRTFLTHIMIL